LASDVKVWSLAVRLASYGIVGLVSSTSYSLTLFFLMEKTSLHNATKASLLAFCLATPISFFGQKVLTFRDRPFSNRQPLRFALLAMSSLILGVGGMYLVTDVLHWFYGFGILIVWFLIPAANFALNTFWVFRRGAASA